MMNKKIVVTGGAGFIGSNLARHLANEKNHVVVIDNLSTGHLENIQDLIAAEKVEFIKGSITELNVLQDAFKGLDYVFHEAALPSVPRSIKEPLLTNQVNISGTLNVLVAAKEAGVKKVIYASSSSVYGDTPTLPKQESMTPNPLSPYAVSKLAGEYYCQVFTSAYGFPTVALRYFNVYGPHQDPASEYAAVIPKFVTRVLNHQDIVMYGDGEQTRDFTYVSDVVHANILAAESKISGVFNMAGGKRITLNDLAQTIMMSCKNTVDIVYEGVRPGDIKHSLADISKAEKGFGYIPEYDISEGLKETIKWFQK
ncbi:MAG: SDR family oxidoreductase [Thermoplasmata archaeon]|nr:SDR family oxidoreductase [Thermoplasmata archaeon]